MPGAATHIAVADKIYAILGKKGIADLPLFFSGSIAPDAIHAKQNYTREDKRHTHLTIGMPTDAFHSPAMLKLFHERVNEFIRHYYFNADKEKDLYLGYVVHLLTDELYNITKRTPFNRLQFMQSTTPEEQEFFGRILADIEYGDKLILSSYTYTQDVPSVLDAIWDYDIKGYVGKDELNNSKRYVISKFMNPSAQHRDLRYYSYDEAVDFIDYAVEHIIERISGKSSIAKMI